MASLRQFFVYVIELRSIERRYTKDVYVGSSALSPEMRFQKHMTHDKSSRHVRHRGVRLLPALYARRNPLLSRSQAREAEQRLRKELEARGYRVYGSCSPEKPGCWL